MKPAEVTEEVNLVYTYHPAGVCSRLITVTLEDGIVKDVVFEGGCSGNLQGVSKLVRGMRAEEVIGRLKDIKCGFKPTSCPDQLARAIEKALGAAQKKPKP